MYQSKPKHLILNSVLYHFTLYFMRGTSREVRGGWWGGGVQRGPTKQGIIKQFSLKCSRSHQTQMLV